MISEDDFVVLLSLALSWVFLILVVISSTKKRQQLVIHLSIQFVYSAYFVNGLYFGRPGGGAIVWWFFYLVVIWAHTFCLIVQFTRLLSRIK